VTATKAVAFAVTPGMERIKFATLWSQRRGIGPYVEFVRSEESLDPEVHPEMMEVVEWKTNYKVRARGAGFRDSPCRAPGCEPGGQGLGTAPAGPPDVSFAFLNVHQARRC